MIGIVGIALSLGLLMYLAYRGVSVIILAPVLALMACVFNGGVPLLATYTQVFMSAMGGFAIKYFPIFLLGAIFGKLMEDTGCARAIAKLFIRRLGARNGIVAIVLACGLLEYGGVSAFVVAFSVYPLGAALFRELDIPKRLLGGTIALGAFTFAMTALPGTAQIHNLIPMPYFQTTAFAAPLLGLVGGACMLGGGVLWLNRQRHLAAQQGEGYGEGHTNEPTATSEQLPPVALAVLPIVLVIAVNFVLVEYLIPTWDTAYLAEATYGGTEIGKLRGLWAMILSLVVANLAVILIHVRSVARLRDTLRIAANGSLLPTFNTASEVGYGATIAGLTAFALVKNAVINISPGNPLISEWVAINTLAGITGSASGG